MYEILEEFLTEFVNYAIMFFEFVGVIVLIISGIKGIKDYIQHNPQIRLSLAEGMALSLEFKLGSEILRTVIVRELKELVFVAGIIILRAALTYLIHWEIDYEERAKNLKMRQQAVEVLEKDGACPQSVEEVEALLPETGKQKDKIEKVLDARFHNDEKREKAQQKLQEK